MSNNKIVDSNKQPLTTEQNRTIVKAVKTAAMSDWAEMKKVDPRLQDKQKRNFQHLSNKQTISKIRAVYETMSTVKHFRTIIVEIQNSANPNSALYLEIMIAEEERVFPVYFKRSWFNTVNNPFRKRLLPHFSDEEKTEVHFMSK